MKLSKRMKQVQARFDFDLELKVHHYPTGTNHLLIDGSAI